jgi:hypothetical protein
MSESVEEQLREEEPRWARAYSFVLGFFALEILLLYLFTVRFS